MTANHHIYVKTIEIFRLLVALTHQPIPAVAWVVVVIWAVVILELITKVCNMFRAVLFDGIFHSCVRSILLNYQFFFPVSCGKDGS